MAIRSGFFNSVNGDRKYDAGRFAEYFNSFIGNGVFPNPSTNLQVVANDDMTVTVQAGRAWINGYILINDDDYILNIEPADGVLNRIDRIVARYDVVNREITLEVKQGDFGSNAVAKYLQRDADAYELGLADIQVNAGVISITQANITDLRLNSELCGIVHGTVEQVDTTTLFSQYKDWYTDTTGQAETDISDLKTQLENDFNAWFATIQGILDEDTAGNLLSMINEINGKITENKEPITTTLNEGENTITSYVVTPLEVKTPSYVNVLGSLGDFEDLSEWDSVYSASLDTTNKVFGNNSLKVLQGSPTSGVIKQLSGFDISKYYMVSVYQKSNTTDTSSGVSIWRNGSGDYTNLPLEQSDIFVRKGLVFVPTAQTIQVDVAGYDEIGEYPDFEAYFDGLMINEISQEEYDQIQAGTLTIDELLGRYPYVGDMNNATITHQETGDSVNVGKEEGSIYLLEGNNTLTLEGIPYIDISYQQNLKGTVDKNVENVSDLLNYVDNLKSLATEEKNDLVSAINELDANHKTHLAESASDNVHGLSGKIIEESGSNANGTYTKFADGTLICFKSIPSGTAISANSNTTNFDFPIAFIIAPFVDFSITQYIFNPQGFDIYDSVAVGSSSTFWNLRAKTTFTTEQPMMLIAIGRWK